MNIGGGEAADQLVRMMLSGSETAIRLSGSALKNTLALTMALAKRNKVISGKVNLKKMLRETRDLRQFPMTPEQYKTFSKLAKKQKILYSAIRDKDGRGKLLDVILPVTELDRANLVFERMGLSGPKRERTRETEAHQEGGMPSKKDSPLGRDSPDIRPRRSSPKNDRTATMTNERPSVEGRLKEYREQLSRGRAAVPAKEKAKTRPKER